MRILRMGVDPAGLAFGLDKLSHELHPQQYLRELTQNGIEAVQRTPEGRGEVVWDVAPMRLGSGVEKVCCIDNGVGMSADEMIEYINMSFKSGKEQGHQSNFGIGAKVAGLTFNKAGLLYASWKDGIGAMVHLVRDEDSGEYGLAQLRRPDGTYGYSAPIGEEAKPRQIHKHGTMVVLLGNSEDEDTFAAPVDSQSGESQWIASYLTSRYFAIPEGVVVRARDNHWSEHKERPTEKPFRPLRTIRSQGEALNTKSESHDLTFLSDAVVHWWLMPDPRDTGGRSGTNITNGHTAALYGNELYEWMSLAKGAAARLQNFGVLVGANRVVLYVEPLIDDLLSVEPNLTRTRLLLNRQPLPWSRWASEFAEQMPPVIAEMMDSIFSGTSTKDYDRTIRKRLSKIRELLDIHRYQPEPEGEDNATEETEGGRSQDLDTRQEGNGSRGGLGGLSAAIYKLLRTDDGVPAQKKQTQSKYPKVQWQTIKDGSRIPGDLEGRAARYLPGPNMIVANADFVGFEQLTDLIANELHAPRGLIKEIARLEYETVLTETVMSMQSFEGTREWSKEEVSQALSESALTAAVMSRFHVYQSVRRDVLRKAREVEKSSA